MIKHLDINNDTNCKKRRYFTIIVIFHDKKTIHFCSVCIAYGNVFCYFVLIYMYVHVIKVYII